MKLGSTPAVVFGACMSVFGVVFVITAVRGRRSTVRAYLGKIRESIKREIESNLDDWVRRCLEERGKLDESSILGDAGINLTDQSWTESLPSINQLGDAVLSSVSADTDLGSASDALADSILDGVFSGL